MKLVIAQAQWNGYRVHSVPVDYVIDARGGPGFPANHRALLMGNLWAQLAAAGAPGVLWLTLDIALDPGDIGAMAEAVEAAPADVHTGLVKLWPTSTGRNSWIWSHRSGYIGSPVATQDETAPVTYFSHDCLWAPARLLNAAFPEVSACTYTELDIRLSEIAAQLQIPAHVVPGCQPKHLHF